MAKNPLDQARHALQHGRLVEARDIIAAYAENNELSLQHFMAKGLAELGMTDWKGAAQTFGAAVKRYHANHECWAYLGLAQLSLNDGLASMASFEKSLSLNPSNGVAASNLANAYRLYGRFEEAERVAYLGSRTHPDKTWAMNMLGLVLAARGKFVQAQKVYEESIALEPENFNPYYNLAQLYVSQRKFDLVWPLYAKVQTMTSELRMWVGEGEARILAGDYERGWELYEKRLHYTNDGGAHAKPHPNSKLYQGQDLKGATIAVIDEQGLGDNLHFCRFGLLLDKMGAEITWVMQKPLMRLFADSFPGTVISIKDPVPETDYYIPMVSLPYALGCFTPETWVKPPYFKARSEPVLPPSGSAGPRIGVIWAGSPGHEKDHHRSMPLKALAPFFASVKGQFYAPFLTPRFDEITDEPIIRLDHLIGDYADTAALMKQLDCVVTVDTSGAHMAAALGITTYMMLDYAAEWRWGLHPTRTPWYPSMTMIRQTSPADWDSVVQQLIPLFNDQRAPH